MDEASTASSDFIFWTQLGQGAFGTVWLAQVRDPPFLTAFVLLKQSHNSISSTQQTIHSTLTQEKRREKRFLAIKTINKKSIVTSDEEEQNRKVQR